MLKEINIREQVPSRELTDEEKAAKPTDVELEEIRRTCLSFKRKLEAEQEARIRWDPVDVIFDGVTEVAIPEELRESLRRGIDELVVPFCMEVNKSLGIRGGEGIRVK